MPRRIEAILGHLHSLLGDHERAFDALRSDPERITLEEDLIDLAREVEEGAERQLMVARDISLDEVRGGASGTDERRVRLDVMVERSIVLLEGISGLAAERIGRSDFERLRGLVTERPATLAN